MITEVCDTTAWEALAVYLHEGLLGEMTVRAVLLEALVPFLDGVLSVLGVICQEVDVFFGQSVAGLLKHFPLSKIVTPDIENIDIDSVNIDIEHVNIGERVCPLFPMTRM